MEKNSHFLLPQLINHSSSTKPSDIVFQYMWEIYGYKTVYDISGTSLISPEFSTPSNNSLKWAIILDSRLGSNNCNTENDDGFVNLRLKFVCVDKNVRILAQPKFSLLDSKGRIAHSRTSVFREFKNGQEYGFKNFIFRKILHEKKNGLLPDDKLSVLCEITISSTPNSALLRGMEHAHDVDHMSMNLPPCTSALLDDLSQLFENQELCDVTISANGEEFKAHKCILSARSTVFRAMFQHGMKESQNNRIEITDVEPEVFRELLRYVYTGSIKSTQMVTLDLLIAADKYDLQRLKCICDNTLCKSLSNDNAAKALIIADLHQAEKLMAAAISFIKSNPLHVMITEGWKNLLVNYPYLINDISKSIFS